MFEDNVGLLVIGLCGGLVAALLIMFKLRLAMLFVGLMLFTACLAVAEEKTGRTHNTWLFLVQEQRSLIYLGAALVILVGMVGSIDRLSLRSIAPQALMLMIIGMYQGFMRLFHESPVDSALTASFALATIAPLMLTLPATLERRPDWFALIRLIMWVNIIWVGATAIQFAIQRSLVVLGTDARFIGLTGNPQHTATLLAIAAVVAMWLVLNDPKWRYQWLWIGMVGINLILLGWTGSRTGALMVVVGLTTVLYRRIGRGILLLPVAAVATYAAFKAAIALGIDLPLERLTSTEDTRTAAWLTLIEAGRENMLIGTGVFEAGKSENSYLYGFAAFGIGVLLLMLLFVLISMIHCLKLYRAGRYLPDWRPIIDLLLGLNMMYFAGSLLEGYILSRVSPMIVYMLMMSAMSTKILALNREGQLESSAEEEWEECDEQERDDEAALHEDESYQIDDAEYGADPAPRA